MYSLVYHRSAQQQKGCKIAFQQTAHFMKSEMGPVSTLKSPSLALLSEDPPPSPGVSSCLPFPILCQIVSVRLVKSVKLGQQSPNL